jgi:hypothetical protein
MIRSIVEQSGPQLFGISDHELVTRRNYVTTTRQFLHTMREEVSSVQAAVSNIHPVRAANKANDYPAEDDQAEWARQEQQVSHLVRRDDFCSFMRAQRAVLWLHGNYRKNNNKDELFLAIYAKASSSKGKSTF